MSETVKRLSFKYVHRWNDKLFRNSPTLPRLRQLVLRPETERRTAIRETVPTKASVEAETSTIINKRFHFSEFEFLNCEKISCYILLERWNGSRVYKILSAITALAGLLVACSGGRAMARHGASQSEMKVICRLSSATLTGVSQSAHSVTGHIPPQL